MLAERFMFTLMKEEITGEALYPLCKVCLATAMHYGPFSQYPQEQEEYTNQ